MQYLYSYAYVIELLKNDTNGLENTYMFNDTLKLYKNMKNVLNFKLRDRDRRTVTFENKTAKVVIIDDYTDLVVSTLYLSLSEDGKLLKADVMPEQIRDLSEGVYYSFMVTLEDAEGVEEPLYVDHNFGVTARVQIVKPYSQPTEILVEGTSKRTDNFKRDMEFEHFFTDFIYHDDDFLNLEFKAYDGESTCDVMVQVNNGKYVPAKTSENAQWRDYQQYFGIGGSEATELSIPKHTYYRIVVKTPTPEKFFLVKRVIDR